MSRVVLVEDDELSATVISKLLEKIGGHSVRVCQRGDEVLRAARAGEVDAVVIDIRLRRTTVEGAQVDGLRLTQLLKSHLASARVPVLLATAHAMHGDDVRLLAESGADAYVSKPITNFKAFVARVDSLIAQSSKARPAGTLRAEPLRAERLKTPQRKPSGRSLWRRHR